MNSTQEDKSSRRMKIYEEILYITGFLILLSLLFFTASLAWHKTAFWRTEARNNTIAPEELQEFRAWKASKNEDGSIDEDRKRLLEALRSID